MGMSAGVAGQTEKAVSRSHTADAARYERCSRRGRKGPGSARLISTVDPAFRLDRTALFHSPISAFRALDRRQMVSRYEKRQADEACHKQIYRVKSKVELQR
jgi:hypothetical protein